MDWMAKGDCHSHAKFFGPNFGLVSDGSSIFLSDGIIQRGHDLVASYTAHDIIDQPRFRARSKSTKASIGLYVDVDTKTAYVTVLGGPALTLGALQYSTGCECYKVSEFVGPGTSITFKMQPETIFAFFPSDHIDVMIPHC